MSYQDTQRRTKFYLLNMPGGSAHIACAVCQPDAEQDELRHGLISVAEADPVGENCEWCGLECIS